MAEVKSTRRALLEDGSLIKVYNSKTFINIAEAYNIDKVRFSVVDIGTAGQNPVDIYLDCEKLRQFLAEVDNGVALKKIAADTGNYPTAYQWVMGQNGAKKLFIGGGKAGVRVQVSDADKKINKFAVLQISDLRELSFMYKLTTGLIKVDNDSYYGKLLKIFKENEGKYSDSNKDSETNEETDVVQETTSSNIVGMPVQTYTVKTNGKILSQGGYKGIPVIIKDTNEETVLVLTDKEANVNWFKKLEEVLDLGEIKELNVKASKKGKNLRFVEVLKKSA